MHNSKKKNGTLPNNFSLITFLVDFMCINAIMPVIHLVYMIYTAHVHSCPEGPSPLSRPFKQEIYKTFHVPDDAVL